MALAYQPEVAEIEVARIPTVNQVEWDAEFDAYIASRGISRETMERCGVLPCLYRFGAGEQRALAFPYKSPKSGLVYAIKVRSIETKDFRCLGSPKSLYLAEMIVDGQDAYLVEGEIDALSMWEVGLCGVSVPNGASRKLSDVNAPFDDRKLSCLWHSRPDMQRAARVIIASDNDGPGQVMAEEAARRLGKATVHRVVWEGGKDANDILVAFGRDGLLKQASAALPWPLEGVRSVMDFADDVLELYRNGNARGLSTGIRSIDKLYNVAPGMLTVLTGHPASGKSEWLDQVMINLAREHDWKFAVCSFENPTKMHIAKMVEKLLQEPFFDSPFGRMSEERLMGALDFLGRHFTFLDFSDGTAATIAQVLDRADAAIQRMGCRGVVIDPFNYLSPTGQDGWSATAISDMLTVVRRFAVSHDAHVWMVAHPAKMLRSGDELPVPDGMAISGSYAWWAKADFGMTIHRQDKQGTVLARCWKARFKWLGGHGDVDMLYDPATGVYTGLGELPDGGLDIAGEAAGHAVEAASEDVVLPF